MKKKSSSTPRGRIRSAIRQLWMRSRERATALKSTKYSCSKCNVKQSVAKGRIVKIQVHHEPAIDKHWKYILDYIAKHILESNQIPLCVKCHKDLHEKEKENK